LFIAHDAAPNPSQLWLCDEDSCPEFERWRQLRKSGIALDFRRIARGGRPLPLDLSGFERGGMIGGSARLYRRGNDGTLIVVKGVDVAHFGGCEIEREIENLSSLRHPLIAAPWGFAVRERELRIGRLHAAGGSLAEVLATRPAWWTPTAKAEAVVAIALGLRYAHSFGLLHGGLKASNVLFDGEGRIQIADFRPMRRDGGFSGDGEAWSPRADVWAFAMLLHEIVVGSPGPLPSGVDGEVNVISFPGVPVFVSEIIE
jgi:hypothetical protein